MARKGKSPSHAAKVATASYSTELGRSRAHFSPRRLDILLETAAARRRCVDGERMEKAMLEANGRPEPMGIS